MCTCFRKKKDIHRHYLGEAKKDCVAIFSYMINPDFASKRIKEEKKKNGHVSSLIFKPIAELTSHVLLF